MTTTTQEHKMMSPNLHPESVGKLATGAGLFHTLGPGLGQLEGVTHVLYRSHLLKGQLGYDVMAGTVFWKEPPHKNT